MHRVAAPAHALAPRLAARVALRVGAILTPRARRVRVGRRGRGRVRAPPLPDRILDRHVVDNEIVETVGDLHQPRDRRHAPVQLTAAVDVA
eukprot:1613950-Prymnesium_polylepis.1